MSEDPAKSIASFWLEAKSQNGTAKAAAFHETRRSVYPGFLIHAHMLAMRPEQKRKLLFLDRIRLEPTHVLDCLCRASASQDEVVMRTLRSDAALALAEFFYAIHAFGLTCRDDSLVFLDLLNSRAAAMTKRGGSVALQSVFTDIELLHFEDIWRASPGAFEEATLARCLAHAIPEKTFEPLIAACEVAGFLARELACLSRAVSSTGAMEAVVAECLSERCDDGCA